MSEKNIELKMTVIVEFKKQNSKMLLEWKNLIDDARKTIFETYCLKNYQKECEPWYCSLRITGKCKYPEELTKLDNAIRLD